MLPVGYTLHGAKDFLRCGHRHGAGYSALSGTFDAIWIAGVEIGHDGEELCVGLQLREGKILGRVRY
jgi:hypothetical protein